MVVRFCKQVKEKQRGAKRMLLPSVQGQEGGKWIAVDSGMFLSYSCNFFGMNPTDSCDIIFHQGLYI